MNTTLDIILDILAPHAGVDRDAITPQSKFIGDLPLDSLDVYEFIIAIEEKFGLEIPDDDIHKLPTVGDLAAYIDERIAARSAATA